MNKQETVILGAGVTGLAAGIASGSPVFEAAEQPGGICASYHVDTKGKLLAWSEVSEHQAYHFEVGGGHWIFGADLPVLHFIEGMTPIRHYSRRSAVFFPEKHLLIPYPLQNNLRFLDRELVAKALRDMASTTGSASTMKEWLLVSFGQTLCDLFFFPFHDLYTANLYGTIAPQDSYKSPLNLIHAINGAFDQPEPVGYNTTFAYPEQGLDTLARAMASLCDVHYNKTVLEIDVESKVIRFSDDTSQPYQRIISTLPLNRMLELTGLKTDIKSDPYTSVLVLNIGASKGKRCPEEHWLYVPKSQGGFHRVGFYSNVDPLFLPMSSRKKRDRVSIYVERSFVGGQEVSVADLDQYAELVIGELQQWEFIKDVEVVHSTWIDIAYTWSWPESQWKHKALNILQSNSIFQVGRYGRWIFQGIADSIRDGLLTGICYQF